MSGNVQVQMGHHPSFHAVSCLHLEASRECVRRSPRCIITLRELLQNDSHVLRLQAIHKRKRPANLARCQ